MPTKLALLSDIHGDIHALDEALRAIDELGCELALCAGDLVDFGLFPGEVIARLMDRGVPTVLGNHDRWAFERDQGGGAGGTHASELGARELAWLRGLPRSWRRSIEGVSVAMHHGSPKGDLDGLKPDEVDAGLLRAALERADADVLVVGHTHIAAALSVGARVVVNPGALLRDPAERGTRLRTPGTFGVLELPSRRFTAYHATGGVAHLERRSFY